MNPSVGNSTLALAAWVQLFLHAAIASAVSYRATMLPIPDGASSATPWAVFGSQKAGYARGFGPRNDWHAVLWSAPSQVIDLHPQGFIQSSIADISENVQVGSGSFSTIDGSHIHALMWTGSADSVVDLHPTGAAFSSQTDSTIHAISGTVKVGNVWQGNIRDNARAIMWTGTSESVIDLHPAGFAASFAADVSGDYQVGAGTFNRLDGGRALLWRGSAESVVNLHPVGFQSSSASAVWGNVQAGSGYSPGAPGTHALMWHGTADSVLDLNPPGFFASQITDINGSVQVGFGRSPNTGDGDHALVWRGTPNSAIDLHSFLTELPITFPYSSAEAVNDDGTIVGSGYDGQRSYPLIWTPIIPEPNPSTLVVCGFAIVALASRRRYWHSLSSQNS